MSAAESIQRSTTAPLDPGSEEMSFFCQMIEDRAGIFLKPAKYELVRTRLRSRLDHYKFKSFSEYRKYLRSLTPNDPEWETFTNLLTTNKTDFFREEKHFQYLVESILPKWLKTNEKTFKVWSAACSTGEEPYTLAMVLSKHLPPDRDFKILATDIDTNVLAQAQNGVYPISKRREIPAEYQKTSIEVGTADVRGWFRMKSHLKDKIVFKQHNLIEKTTPGDQVFNAVFCRNVLIYFAPESINFVQKKIFSTVKKDGHFFIGHSESLQGMNHQWKLQAPSVFWKQK